MCHQIRASNRNSSPVFEVSPAEATLEVVVSIMVVEEEKASNLKEWWWEGVDLVFIGNERERGY